MNVASRLMEVAAQHDARLSLSDSFRIEAESGGGRLTIGGLTGPFETQIRGRSGSLSVWFWRGEPELDASII